MLRKLLTAHLFTLIFAGCAEQTCPDEKTLVGKEAEKLILERETFIPGTYVVVPDTMLLSSTRAVEGPLRILQDSGYLRFALLDSTRHRLTLAGPHNRPLTTATFYRYKLRWNERLDELTLPDPSRAEVTTSQLFGVSYDGELRFTGRFLRGGNLQFDPATPATYKKDCKAEHMQYAYKIPKVHLVARMSGLAADIRGIRTVDIPVTDKVSSIVR
ncbi:hypothetical protein ACWKWU_17990 [Chitinophaga lutea]